jgi:hypothetical protein
MDYAIVIGAQYELEQMFHKWDTAIALAPPNEIRDMGRAAILEVQKLLDIHPEYSGGLTINGIVEIEKSRIEHEKVMQPVYIKKDK